MLTMAPEIDPYDKELAAAVDAVFAGLTISFEDEPEGEETCSDTPGS